MVRIKEKKDFNNILIDFYLEKKDNNSFFNQYFSNNKFFSKKRDSDNKNKWDNEDNNGYISQIL